MLAKKAPQRAAGGGKKPAKASGSSSLRPTEKERAALRKGAAADMKKHGFKTVDELIAYYDSKRGY